MTDLDTFRRVLRGSTRFDDPPVPLHEIMAAGKRLRRRRRLTTATMALGLSAVAVLGAGVFVQQDKQTTTSVIGDPTPAPNGIYSPVGSWGTAVQTGIQQESGELVITAIHRDDPAAPGVGFGLRICWAQTDGSLQGCRAVGKAKPPAHQKGFGLVSLPIRFSGLGDLPMFGYYDGPATKITAKSDGTEVVAQTAVWSEDPDVVIWWFPFEQVPILSGGKRHVMSDWAARDDDGNRLPTGKFDFYQV